MSLASAEDAEKVNHDIDVAVVGGGPGGLAIAAAVLSAFGQRIRVKVRQQETPRGRTGP